MTITYVPRTKTLVNCGVVVLASCGIGISKADDTNPDVIKSKNLILASVVHCCQDHNQVRTPCTYH